MHELDISDIIISLTTNVELELGGLRSFT